jgi:hypothetical protein
LEQLGQAAEDHGAVGQGPATTSLGTNSICPIAEYQPSPALVFVVLGAGM